MVFTPSMWIGSPLAYGPSCLRFCLNSFSMIAMVSDRPRFVLWPIHWVWAILGYIALLVLPIVRGAFVFQPGLSVRIGCLCSLVVQFVRVGQAVWCRTAFAWVDRVQRACSRQARAGRREGSGEDGLRACRVVGWSVESFWCGSGPGELQKGRFSCSLCRQYAYYPGLGPGGSTSHWLLGKRVVEENRLRG
jgi:hypothetical protein